MGIIQAGYQFYICGVDSGGGGTFLYFEAERDGRGIFPYVPGECGIEPVPEWAFLPGCAPISETPRERACGYPSQELLVLFFVFLIHVNMAP